MNDYFKTAPVGGGDTSNFNMDLNAAQTDKMLKMKEDAQTANTWMNVGNGVMNFGMDLTKSIMSYQMMNAMIGLKRDELEAHKEIRFAEIGLQNNFFEKQETIGLAQLKTSERLGELTKERDVEVAKARSSAAVQIAKVNALNSQFYGQPNELIN